jgi:SAM-dependent methyltransferase
MAAGALAVAEEQPSDREVLRAFLEWAHSQGLGGSPAKYRFKLTSDGLSPAEVDRRMKIITDPSRQTERIDEFWSLMAEKPGNAQFRTTPSKWLVQCVGGSKPGRALDLGMGQGRNALYLTRQGWDVTGIDSAEVAVEQAKAQAAQLGVKYTTIIGDIGHWDFGQNQWDLIAAIFEPDTEWVRQICAGLKPGGLFVRENYVFTKEDNEPLKKFIDLRILRYEDRLDDPDYHPAGENAKPERVQRMLAQKV